MLRKPDLAEPGGVVHKSKNIPDDLVRFSFRHYQITEKFCLPTEKASVHKYAGVLLERLRDVSGMKVSEFRRSNNKTLRSHSHDWDHTTEKAGYAHLPEQLQQCEPWQFSISANEHGRVHGILIDGVFYVVWLDPSHKLYK